ncbi:hypothetical protein GUJ93_ZPchr0001g31918 [Zizania palustris]|uniref:Uncharacterized protein n=1 Tax=Zizania palustris TaxID=103762 RepID=A0A8J5VP75_ZIZPA|nr:hypothetical protein GUJ93_ZPchr0001g31918 [Zizania palustris]
MRVARRTPPSAAAMASSVVAPLPESATTSNTHAVRPKSGISNLDFLAIEDQNTKAHFKSTRSQGTYGLRPRSRQRRAIYTPRVDVEAIEESSFPAEDPYQYYEDPDVVYQEDEVQE